MAVSANCNDRNVEPIEGELATLSGRMNVRLYLVIRTSMLPASGGRYWLMERSCSARRCTCLGELRANDLFVELPNARLRNGLDEMDAIGHRILRDHALGREIGDV